MDHESSSTECCFHSEQLVDRVEYVAKCVAEYEKSCRVCIICSHEKAVRRNWAALLASQWTPQKLSVSLLHSERKLAGASLEDEDDDEDCDGGHRRRAWAFVIPSNVLGSSVFRGALTKHGGRVSGIFRRSTFIFLDDFPSGSLATLKQLLECSLYGDTRVHVMSSLQSVEEVARFRSRILDCPDSQSRSLGIVDHCAGQLERQIANFRKLNRLFRSSQSAAMVEVLKDHPAIWKDYHAEFERRRKTWDIDPAQAIGYYLAKNSSRFQLRDDSDSSNYSIFDFGAGESLLLERSFLEHADSDVPVSRIVAVDYSCSDAAQRINSEFAGRRLCVAQVEPFALDVADTRQIVQLCGSATFAVFCLALSGMNTGHYLRSALYVLRASESRVVRLVICEAAFRFRRDHPTTIASLEAFLQAVTLGSADISAKDCTPEIVSAFCKHSAAVVGPNPHPSFMYILISLCTTEELQLAPIDDQMWDVSDAHFFATKTPHPA
eukprot:ANDGO_05556.mRNA.1 hypothetical protein